MQNDNNTKYQLYEQLIADWLKKLRTNPSKVSDVNFYEQCYSQFCEDLKKQTKINIIFDNTAGNVLQKMLCHPKYIRWSEGIQMKGQPCYILLKINHFLYIFKKFISKKKFQKMQESSSYNLEHQLKILAHSLTSHNEHPTQQIIVKKWNQYVKISIQQFWVNFIKERPQYQNTQQIAQMLIIMEKVIKKRLGANQFAQLKVKLCKNMGVNQFLHKIVYENCLYYSKSVVQAYIQQIQKLKKAIYDRFGSQIKSIDVYGSFASGFAISYASDIDICIQFNKLPHYENGFEQRLLKNLSYSLKDKFKQIFSIIYIPTAKVPFIKITPLDPMTSSFLPKNIDIVCNNAHGVDNSLLLAQYSKIPYVRDLGILVKFWAKSKKIIDPFKFSSYSIILMVLYYLIREGYLPFLENLQYDKKGFQIPQIKVKQNKFPSLYQGFLGFLELYSENSVFFQKEQVVRITKYSTCQINPNGFLNMIDPLNHSNPGRVKQKNKYQFFNYVNTAKYALKTQDIKQIQKIFEKSY